MEAKKRLAKLIVANFHGNQAAFDADNNWTLSVQQGEVPNQIEEARVSYSRVEVNSRELINKPGNYFPIPSLESVLHPSRVDFIKLGRLDKTIFEAAMSGSVTDASRKIKARAVRVNQQIVPVPYLAFQIPVEFILNVGRLWKKVRITE